MQVGGGWEAPGRFAEAFNVFGFEWTREELRWYVNGVLVHTVQNARWHQPLALIFASETLPEWFGMPKDSDLPSTFSDTPQMALAPPAATDYLRGKFPQPSSSLRPECVRNAFIQRRAPGVSRA